MTPQDVKDQITLEDIRDILESLGCEKIEIHGNTLTSTKGGGSDNPSGIVIWDNGNFFNAEMYTTPSFQDYKVKDVFSVIRQLTGKSFDDAVSLVGGFVDLKEPDHKEGKSIKNWLNKIDKSSKSGNNKEQLYYDIGFLDQFIPFLHDMWKEEGITEETAKKFDIRYDTATECIIIPILDQDGNLVGVKSRETKPSEHKYSYELRSRKSLVLYGLYQNLESIRKKKEVIVFEAEKSVLKADSMGITNAVAIGGKIVSVDQARMLQNLNVDVILALDEDVSDEDIMKNVHKISFPFLLGNVYVLKDDRMRHKESPADNEMVMMDYKNNVLKAGVGSGKRMDSLM